MSNNDIFSDFLTKKISEEHDDKGLENDEIQEVEKGEELNNDFSSFNFSFNQDENESFYPSLSTEEHWRPERRQFREAKLKMTKEEYRQRLEELNEDADNKNFIIFFGVPNSGKSYIIASLLHYMNAYLDGTTRLNRDVSTKEEELLYNQMAEMFINLGKNIGRTSIQNFFELNVIYTPNAVSKREIELTFLDASGENLKRIYKSVDDEYEGELPDYLEAVLESDVECYFVFVHDQSNERNSSPPQSEILKAMYDKVLGIQDKYNKVYPKVLLISKADKIPEKTKNRYGGEAEKYALSKESNLRTFAQGFLNEKNSPNRIRFYSIGTFTKHDDLSEFDADCPRRLFDNWIYRGITGDTVRVPESLLKRFLRWLWGK